MSTNMLVGNVGLTLFGYLSGIFGNLSGNLSGPLWGSIWGSTGQNNKAFCFLVDWLGVVDVLFDFVVFNYSQTAN